MAYKIGSLVKETSITTGTGSYALLGAVTNYRAFSTIDTPAAGLYIPYVARMEAGWEIGVGELTAAGTLVRFLILESSNAGAAVNWGAGTKTIICAQGALGGFPAGRHNINAGAYPTSTDNYADGYGFGSIWSQSSGGGNAFICVDPGTSGSPSAVWRLLSGPKLSHLGNFGPRASMGIGAYAYERTVALDAICVGGDGGAIDYNGSQVHGYGWTANQLVEGGHQRVNLGAIAETTNATPAEIFIYDTGGDGKVLIPQDSCSLVKASIVARNDADDVVSTWTAQFAVKRQGAGDPAIVGSAAPTLVGQDAGAATWAVAFTINTTDDALAITVTGEAAKTIRWTVGLELTQVAFT